MSDSPDTLRCFKAYDIRGRVPDELDDDRVYRIARAYAEFVGGGRIVVGYDIRPSSPRFAEVFRDGLTASGVDAIDIGVGGTEEVYFATFHLGADGGAMVTASHNPSDYNGIKLVREGSRPISSDTGLADIRERVLRGGFAKPDRQGDVHRESLRNAYVDHVLGYVDVEALEPFKVVVNPGNGGAGLVIDRLERHLPFEFVKVHHEPDGTFPNGIPNPLLPDNRASTSEAVTETGADIGIAWDGDFDRCFLFDETGAFIEGYYIVGLLASSVLEKHPGAKIVHDPRLTWNTVEIVREAGGSPVQSKSGHAFIKEVMRREDAAYGGEMSAHHFFREFSYCDSGMIPWMLVLEIMGKTGKKLSELVGERVARFPASGEINRRIDDPDAAFEAVRARYAAEASKIDETDGIGFDFEDWRFNLRKSNTEPLVRLNVESRGDAELMKRKTDEVLSVIGGKA